MHGCHLAAAQLPQADSAAPVAVETNDPPGAAENRQLDKKPRSI